MMRVGITGGIGSGKTTACREFEALGIPVFYADEEAKKAYEDPDIREAVINRLGPEVYNGSFPNREVLAQLVFNRPELLTWLNGLIHPRVGQRYREWSARQTGPYQLREAAILIEAGAHKDLDAVIVITAEPELRLRRLLSDRNMTEEDVKARMSRQMTDEERLSYADYRIVNNGTPEDLKDQIHSIHEDLLRRSAE